MSSTPIHYAKPSITEREVAYATDAARDGWGPRCYEYIGRFERQFAEHLGVKHAIATASCTGAMHMGLAALGIGPGDEVIVPDITWIATASPVLYLGARPVFVDVLPDSWCIDPARVAEAITPRTKAIVAVHLYGNLADLDALRSLGERHGLPVIEDAAEAVGSQWRGARAGALGRFGTFSFHGTKTLTTGEGGMFVTQDSALHQRVLTLSNHGRAAGQYKQFWSDELGYKYKMSNVQAALGCGQVERIDELIAGKRRVFEAYRERLQGLPLALNPEPAGTVNGCWMPTMVVDESQPFDRDAMLADFAADRIDGRTFFWPLSAMPMFAPHAPDAAQRHPVAYGLTRRACNLPSYHELTDAEIDRVCAIVRRHVGG